jgi:nicotinamidase/pyrazinamidase
MTTLPADVALLVIDLQPDFMPGGALACEDGDALVAPIAALLAERRYRTVVATQDWHPADHASFAKQHAGKLPFEAILLHAQPQTLWPDHCVQGTEGAALHPGVDWTAADLILRKGTRRDVDSYSAFRENHGPDGSRPATGLAGWLHERGIREVHVCGLARDYCVLWSAQDAAKAGFWVKFLWELTRPVTEANDGMVHGALAKAKIAVI